MSGIRIFVVFLLYYVTNVKTTTREGNSELSAIVYGGYYDKIVHPRNEEAPVDVAISFYVSDAWWEANKFSSILYFRQGWTDPRLRHNSSNDIVIECKSQLAERLWVPDTHIFEAIKQEYFDEACFVQVSPAGEVIKSQKIFLITTCPYSPPSSMDKLNLLNCSLTMESYANPSKVIKLIWKAKKQAVIWNSETNVNAVSNIVLQLESAGDIYLKLKAEFEMKIASNGQMMQCLSRCGQTVG